MCKIYRVLKSYNVMEIVIAKHNDASAAFYFTNRYTPPYGH